MSYDSSFCRIKEGVHFLLCQLATVLENNARVTLTTCVIAYIKAYSNRLLRAASSLPWPLWALPSQSRTRNF